MALEYPCYWMRKDNRGEWRWTYYATNGEEIAVSSEGYKNKTDCRRGVDIMQASGNDAIFATD
jgi:uncharacterized protein